MGSGKTTVSKLLFEKLKDFNYLLKIDDLTWNFTLPENGDFHTIHNTIFSIAYSVTDTCLSLGSSVIVEKVMNFKRFSNFIEIGEKFKISPLQVILSIPVEVAIERVKVRRKQDGKEFNDEYLEKINRSHSASESIVGLYSNQIVIPAEKYTPEQICEMIIAKLNA